LEEGDERVPRRDHHVAPRPHDELSAVAIPAQDRPLDPLLHSNEEVIAVQVQVDPSREEFFLVVRAAHHEPVRGEHCGRGPEVLRPRRQFIHRSGGRGDLAIEVDGRLCKRCPRHQNDRQHDHHPLHHGYPPLCSRKYTVRRPDRFPSPPGAVGNGPPHPALSPGGGEPPHLASPPAGGRAPSPCLSPRWGESPPHLASPPVGGRGIKGEGGPS